MNFWKISSISIIVLVIYFLGWNFQKKPTDSTPFTDDSYILATSEDIKQPVSCTISLRERRGRLGNRLFMFATALGLALTYSCNLNISTHIFHKLNQSFELHLPRIVIQSRPNHSEPEEKLYNYCSSLASIFPPNSTSRSIELTGFWQVHRYFSPHAPKIRRQLRFRSSILARVDHFLQNIYIHSNDTVTRVGVHIRRGDFLEVRTVSTERYVLAAMSHFTRKYQSVVFVIVTDDRAYCSDTYDQRKNVFFTPPSFDAASDLATLTRCNHVIITVGTFGWWGAFLLHHQTGEVLTDAKADHTPIDTNCRSDLYFPPWFSFLDNKRR